MFEITSWATLTCHHRLLSQGQRCVSLQVLPVFCQHIFPWRCSVHMSCSPGQIPEESTQQIWQLQSVLLLNYFPRCHQNAASIKEMWLYHADNEKADNILGYHFKSCLNFLETLRGYWLRPIKILKEAWSEAVKCVIFNIFRLTV